jgi:hypothetical protein
MTAGRNLTGLVRPERASPPDRTVTAAPPRRRAVERGTAPVPTVVPQAEDRSDRPVRPTRRQRRQPTVTESVTARRGDDAKPREQTTVRISVNIPLACKQWLASKAREEQRFVSEVLMEALEHHGGDVSPPSGRARRVAVPDGTIYNIVLPTRDRQRLDDIVARNQTTRSALVTEVLLIAVRA